MNTLLFPYLVRGAVNVLDTLENVDCPVGLAVAEAMRTWLNASPKFGIFKSVSFFSTPSI